MPAARQHKQVVGLSAGTHPTFSIKSRIAIADSEVVVLTTHAPYVVMNYANHKLVTEVMWAHAKSSVRCIAGASAMAGCGLSCGSLLIEPRIIQSCDTIVTDLLPCRACTGKGRSNGTVGPQENSPCAYCSAAPWHSRNDQQREPAGGPSKGGQQGGPAGRVPHQDSAACSKASVTRGTLNKVVYRQ